MPQIQGYSTGSPDPSVSFSHIHEVTVTQSGAKYFLDTNGNSVMLGDSDGTKLPVLIDPYGRILIEEQFNEIIKQLKIINLHLGLMNDTVINKTEVE